MAPRLAIVTSHPIQYQAPLFRLLVERAVVEPKVFFLSDHGVAPSFDPGLDRVVRFDVPLNEGYDHHFVQNVAPQPNIHGFFHAIHPELAVQLASGDFSALMVLGYAQLSDWIAYATAAASGLPILLRGESMDPTPAQRSTRGWRLKRIALGALVEQSHSCLAIGLSNARFYFALGATPEQVRFAPYSVDDTAFRAGGEVGRAERSSRLQALGLDPDRRTAVFAAKFIPRKRVFDAIEAVDRMDGRAQLVIIGDGPLRDDVEARVKEHEHIRCIGFVNQSELPAWYGVADIIVLPSDYETWGLIVNEAMAAGAVPVVADVVGCGPDLAGGGAGRIFRTGDIEDLRRCLDELLDDAALESARAAGRERLPRYSLEATAVAIEQAVLDAAGARHATPGR